MSEAVTTQEPSIFDLPEWTGEPTSPQESLKPRWVGVRFQPVGKIYHYSAEGFEDLKIGDWVIVDTARGKQMAQVATFKPPKDPQGTYKRIERRATGRDMAMRHFYQQKELEALIACRAEAAALKLPVKIVRAEYSFDGQTLTFLYTTDQEVRVEVAPLREAMSRLYRARIETRQISPREVAKIIGGAGACGIDQRCCSRFLTEFSPISIKHAKEQNLSLDPKDIAGMCGRLRCCLIFEFEQYVEARRHLPKLKSIVGTPMGPGKVVEILHLRDSVRVRFGEGAEAREAVFHREQLVPLEEFQRLQEKALSGTCDRHENGECTCGRSSGEGAAAAAPEAEPLEPEMLEEASEAEDIAAPASELTSAAEQPTPAKRKRRKRKRKALRPTDIGRPAAQADSSTKPAAASPSSPQASRKRRPLPKRRKR